MDLNERAREATDELLRTTPDVKQGWQSLRQLRRRRRATRAGAVVAVLAVVGVGVGVQQLRPDSTPPVAAGPVFDANGALIGLSVDGDGQAAVTRASGKSTTQLPATAAGAFGPFQFTTDGSTLIYTYDGKLRSRFLATGEDRAIYDCPDRTCNVAVSADGTQLAAWDGKTITRGSMGGGSAPPLAVGREVIFAAWSPDGSRIAFSAYAGAYRQVAYFVVDVASGKVTRLGAVGGVPAAGPAWSPDGASLALLQAHGWDAVRDIDLVVLPTDGSDSTVVRSIGRCGCKRYNPAVTWSPDGDYIATTAVGVPDAHTVGGPVYAVHPDGTDWHQVADGRWVNHLAWQPVVGKAGE